MLLFNGLFRLPGIGLASARMRAPASVRRCRIPSSSLTNGSHPRTYEYNYAGPAAQALLGVEIRLAARVVLRRVQVHLRAL